VKGYFEIGICNGKNTMNVGTLWRSAYQLGATGIFTIGKRLPLQASDTYKTCRQIPLREYLTIEQFLENRPFDCQLIGVEMDGKPISGFTHPARALYVLGAEDQGLPQSLIEKCDHIITLDAIRRPSFNVAVAGSIVMYHRVFNLKGVGNG